MQTQTIKDSTQVPQNTKRRPAKDLIKVSAPQDVPASMITDAWNVESSDMVHIFVGKGWDRVRMGNNRCRPTETRILHLPVQHLLNSTDRSHQKIEDCIPCSEL